QRQAHLARPGSGTFSPFASRRQFPRLLGRALRGRQELAERVGYARYGFFSPLLRQFHLVAVPPMELDHMVDVLLRMPVCIRRRSHALTLDRPTAGRRSAPRTTCTSTAA